MRNQTLFLLIIILILIYILPNANTNLNTNTYTNNNSTNTNTNTNANTNNNSINIIDEYLHETNCEEKFDTMGPKMNIGNNMNFKQNPNNITPLDKILNKTLVPDFEPNTLNINSNLNSHGYAIDSSNKNNFYANKGFIKPNTAAKYADSIQYNLAHPYQTRYC